MISGIGVDIVQIPRIEKLLKQYGETLISRILHDRELEYLVKLNKNEYPNFLAKRFAAKEAFAKAVGTGIGYDFGFRDIAVVNDELGKPIILLSPAKQNILLGYNVNISIADDYPTAIAFVVINVNRPLA